MAKSLLKAHRKAQTKVQQSPQASKSCKKYFISVLLTTLKTVGLWQPNLLQKEVFFKWPRTACLEILLSFFART